MVASWNLVEDIDCKDEEFISLLKNIDEMSSIYGIEINAKNANSW